MALDVRTPTLDPFAARLIRRKARELVVQAGLCGSDREDVAQELTLRLLQRLHRYNPCPENRNAYLTVVVKRESGGLLRELRARRCEEGHVHSLNRMVGQGDGAPTELAETCEDEKRHARRGTASRSDIDKSVLAQDVAAILDQLPDDLRDLCELLKHASVAEVARQLNIPRTTLIGKLHELRARFEKAGVDCSF